LAGRAGIKLALDRFDQFSRKTPMLANLRPSGKYLMEDFLLRGWIAGIVASASPPVGFKLPDHHRKNARENIAGAEIYNTDVIRTLDTPVLASGGLAILYGNLAPNGAVIKASAAETKLLKHTGRAIVFNNFDEMNARIDDSALDADATACWCCVTRARRVHRECPNGETCLFRKNS